MEIVSARYERNRSRLSDKLVQRLQPILPVLQGLKAYWPLTLRQVYYQLVASKVIENNVQEYKKLGNLLARARLEGYVSWEIIEDRVRATLGSAGWHSMDHFIEDESDGFLDGYKRDLLCSQSVAPEVWIEKDAFNAEVGIHEAEAKELQGLRDHIVDEIENWKETRNDDT